MTDDIYIIDGKRTPFGKFGGSLKDVTPVDLAVHCSKGLLESSKINPDQIDHVVLGNVVPSSTDTMYGARHLALKLGCPIKTPGYVINRLCGSGIQSIFEASNMIRLDQAQCVLAGGTENMSMVPHLIYGARFGTKYGAPKTVDMLLDALTDQYCQTPMGITAENLGSKYDITREQCDDFSLESHNKAVSAHEKGLLQGEIIPVEIKRGTCENDEHIRKGCKIEDLRKLRSSFKKDGLVTPGSASGIVDGAASVLVASKKFVQDNNLKPLCRVIDFQVIGVDPKIMGIGPVPAINNLLQNNNLSQNDIDLFEVNEAFAAQALAVCRELKCDSEKLNVWGGAIAIGHPLAATGTRITLTLARALKHFDKKRGIASACIGGGQGVAVLIENL